MKPTGWTTHIHNDVCSQENNLSTLISCWSFVTSWCLCNPVIPSHHWIFPRVRHLLSGIPLPSWHCLVGFIDDCRSLVDPLRIGFKYAFPLWAHILWLWIFQLNTVGFKEKRCVDYNTPRGVIFSRVGWPGILVSYRAVRYNPSFWRLWSAPRVVARSRSLVVASLGRPRFRIIVCPWFSSLVKIGENKTIRMD